MFKINVGINRLFLKISTLENNIDVLQVIVKEVTYGIGMHHILKSFNFQPKRTRSTRPVLGIDHLITVNCKQVTAAIEQMNETPYVLRRQLNKWDYYYN